MSFDAATKAQIEKVLADFWEANVIPVDAEGTGSTSDYIAPLDSMSAVEVLMEIDKLVGKELEAGEIIRPGGYDSKEQFVSDVTERVFAYLEKEVT
jgi:acyl carrier protein